MWYQGQEQCDEPTELNIPSKNTFIHFSQDVEDDCPDDLREHSSVWERQQSAPTPSVRRLLERRMSDAEANSACKDDESDTEQFCRQESRNTVSTGSEPDTEPFCRQETEQAWPTYLAPTQDDLEQTGVSWPTMYPPGSHVARSQVDLAGSAASRKWADVPQEVPPTAEPWQAATEVSWPTMYPLGSHMASNQVDLSGSHCPTAQQWQASSGHASFAIGLDCANSKTRSKYMMIPVSSSMPLEASEASLKKNMRKGKSLIDKALLDRQCKLTEDFYQLQSEQRRESHGSSTAFGEFRADGVSVSTAGQGESFGSASSQLTASFCGGCGGKREPSFRFCMHCGQAL